MRLSGIAWIIVLGFGCGGTIGGSDAGIGADGARPLDAGLDASARPDAGEDAGRPGPDPSCVVPDVVGDIELVPDPPSTAPIVVRVTSATAQTNVSLRICASTGSSDATFRSVNGMYTWEWGAPALPPGEAQLQFVADPDATVYATRRVTVGANTPDAGVPDAGMPGDLCTAPTGSLVDGSFERLEGLVPPGWQVRDPGAPGRCGDPSEHVYLTPPPAGCSGSALAIDARGEWDCYAIQVYTDYDTIRGGGTYRVSALARSVGRENPGGWFFLGLSWLDGGDRVFGDERNPRIEPLDFEWRRVEFEVVAPPEARRAVLWLTAHYEGRMDFDDVSIVPVGG